MLLLFRYNISKYRGLMSVNQKIRVMRKKRNITTTRLAEMLGISQSSIVRYENGSVKYVPQELLNQMAAIFECPLEELTEGDDRYSQKKDSNQKSFTLSEDEHDLLLKYRELSLKEKTAVKGLCDLLISHN